MKLYKVDYKEFYIRVGCAWVDANSKAEAKQMVRDGDTVDNDGGEYETDWTRPITVQKAEFYKAGGE